MVGAGTMVSANYTYNQAPRDGTVINSFDGGLWPSQLYGSSAVQFDMTKFNYIGAPDIFKYIMVVTKKSGITKMEEIMSGAKEVVIGAVPNTSIQHAGTFLRTYGRSGEGRIRLQRHPRDSLAMQSAK